MINSLSKKKVLLGLSGGVDSATAALLLKEKGFEVVGYYFDVTGKNLQGKSFAEEIAGQLGIDLITEDASESFNDIVVKNFCDEYLHGRTPNPCIVCNPNIKFKSMLDQADKIGAYYIATGHYCRVEFDENSKNHYIKRASNVGKDQSYMLYRLGQNFTKRIIFPLGEYESKEEIRTLARDNSLKNADAKDSQEICFVDPETGYAKYIEALGFSTKEGDYVDKNGKILGRHKGILNYTIGQRKGLGIALGKPAFVTKIDWEKNQITLGDEEDLFTTKVISKNNFFQGETDAFIGRTIAAKVRYTTIPSPAKFEISGDKIITTFETPQRAPTPGQSIVFYHPETNWVIGGGIIE